MGNPINTEPPHPLFAKKTSSFSAVGQKRRRRILNGQGKTVDVLAMTP